MCMMIRQDVELHPFMHHSFTCFWPLRVHLLIHSSVSAHCLKSLTLGVSCFTPQCPAHPNHPHDSHCDTHAVSRPCASLALAIFLAGLNARPGVLPALIGLRALSFPWQALLALASKRP